MTTQDRFVDYGTLPTSIPRVLHQWLLGLYTAMPGEIVAYDAATRRADVRGALAVMVKNGRLEEPVDRPVISNVPVLFPASGFMDRMGGFLMSFPLKAGDSVLLLFSMRGLAQWKLTNGRLAVADKAPIPDVDSFLAERDAIAIPGFGPEMGHLPPEGWPSVEVTVEDDNLLRLRVKDPADTRDLAAHRMLEMSPAHILLDFDTATDRRFVEVTPGQIKVQIVSSSGSPEVTLTPASATVMVGGTTMVLTATGVTITAGNVTIAGTTTVNGKAIADQTAGTDAASGPGSHTHGLTAA